MKLKLNIINILGVCQTALDTINRRVVVDVRCTSPIGVQMSDFRNNAFVMRKSKKKTYKPPRTRKKTKKKKRKMSKYVHPTRQHGAV